MIFYTNIFVSSDKSEIFFARIQNAFIGLYYNLLVLLVFRQSQHLRLRVYIGLNHIKIRINAELNFNIGDL